MRIIEFAKKRMPVIIPPFGVPDNEMAANNKKNQFHEENIVCNASISQAVNAVFINRFVLQVFSMKTPPFLDFHHGL
jgi:hypothetical protein